MAIFSFDCLELGRSHISLPAATTAVEVKTAVSPFGQTDYKRYKIKRIFFEMLPKDSLEPVASLPPGGTGTSAAACTWSVPGKSSQLMYIREKLFTSIRHRSQVVLGVGGIAVKAI